MPLTNESSNLSGNVNEASLLYGLAKYINLWWCKRILLPQPENSALGQNLSLLRWKYTPILLNSHNVRMYALSYRVGIKYVQRLRNSLTTRP